MTWRDWWPLAIGNRDPVPLETLEGVIVVAGLLLMVTLALFAFTREELKARTRELDRWRKAHDDEHSIAEQWGDQAVELERERDEARAALAEFQCAAAEVEEQRDEARAEVERLRVAMRKVSLRADDLNSAICDGLRTKPLPALAPPADAQEDPA